MPSLRVQPTEELGSDVIITGYKENIDLTGTNEETSTMQRNVRSAAAKGRDAIKARKEDFFNGEDGDGDGDDDDGTGGYGTDSRSASASSNKSQGKGKAITGKTQTRQPGKPTQSSGGRQRKKEPKKRRRPNLSPEQYYQKIDEQKATIDGLRKQITKKNDKLGNLRASKDSDKQRATASEHDLQEQLNRCRETVAKQETAIAAMQAELLESIEKATLSASSDNEVTEDLSRLLRRVKAWANRWSLEDWNGVRPEKPKNMSDFRCNSRIASSRALIAISMGKIPPRVVVNALANETIGFDTISRPFGFLKSDEDGNYKTTARDRFDWILELARQDSIHNFMNLRMALTKPFTQQKAGFSGPVTRQATSVKPLETAHCRCVAGRTSMACTAFLHSVGSIQRQARDNELLEIIQEAFELGLKLASQLVFTGLYFLPSLKNHRFADSHEFFVPHRGLKLKEDAHDTESPTAEEAGVAGKELDLIVEPAVVREGGSNGENYGEKRLLIKAVIWMVKDEDLQAPSDGVSPAPSEAEHLGPAFEQPPSAAPADNPQANDSTSECPVVELPEWPIQETDFTSQSREGLAEETQAQQETAESRVSDKLQPEEENKEGASADPLADLQSTKHDAADITITPSKLVATEAHTPPVTKAEEQAAITEAALATAPASRSAPQGMKRRRTETGSPTKKRRTSSPPSNQRASRPMSMTYSSVHDHPTVAPIGDARPAGKQQVTTVPQSRSPPSHNSTTVTVEIPVKQVPDTPGTVNTKGGSMKDIKDGIVDTMAKNEP